MAKRNGNNVWAIRILVILALAAVGAAVAFGDWRGGTKKEVTILREDQKEDQAMLLLHDRKITVLETRQEAIYEGVKRIEEKLK